MVDSLLDDLALGYSTSLNPHEGLSAPVHELAAVEDDLSLTPPVALVVPKAHVTSDGQFVAPFNEKDKVIELKNDLAREAKVHFHSLKKLHRLLASKGRAHIMGTYTGGESPNIRDLNPLTLEDIELLFEMHLIESFSYLRNKLREAFLQRGF